MKGKYIKTLIFLTLFLLLGAFIHKSIKITNTTYLSPSYMAYDQSSKMLYISLSTAEKVIVYDTENDAVIRDIPLNLDPAGLAISPDGTTLYIAGMSAKGKLFTIDLLKNKVRSAIPVGHSPHGIALTPNGARLYVANRFSNDVSVIDTKALKEVKRIRVTREPVALAVSKNGNTVFVANHLPTGRSDVNYVSAVVSLISNRELEVIKEIKLPNGSNSLNSITISPDGNHLYISHILANYQMPTTQLEKGWMNTNALSIIDADKMTYYATALLDDVDKGAANPHGVSVTPDGNKILVTLAGTDELCILDRKMLHRKIEQRQKNLTGNATSETMEFLYKDLSFTNEFSNIVKLDGKGFRHVLATNEDVYLTSFFTATLHRLDISSERLKTSIRIGNEPALNMARKGEMLFHDATKSFQGWQSCSSCHPGNARVDALNWDLLNDGLGNPKNTKSLLFAHSTPPSMITGIRPDAETAVRAGIKHIQFTVRPEEEARALDAYLKSLRAIPSPFLIKGRLSNHARKGQRIFEKAGCAHCHSGPYFTNGKKYNVGTGTGNELDLEFDTPSLIEIWRTAPYLNNGSATTLKEVVTSFNRDDKHGKTSGLSVTEIDYLVEYIYSL